MDRTPPTLTTKTRPSLVSNLGGGRYGVFITSRHLQVSDGDQPTAAVAFSIISPPQFGHLENVQTGEDLRGRGLWGPRSPVLLQALTLVVDSRSMTWTSAPSSTSSLSWTSPPTPSTSSSPTWRGTRGHLTGGFVGGVGGTWAPAFSLSVSLRLDLSWSQIQLSDVCYRTCESAAELQIQVQRSGKSAEPAFVAIQVG